jgi:hypothetical protein
MKKNNYLALGGLFITLHLLFIFISKLLTGSEFILVVFLPLLSTIYSLKFNKKEVAMFFIATFILCLLFEPISTFIYVLPALICGTTYGLLRKKKVRELSLVYISSLAHSLTLLIAFLAISIMFKEVDFFAIFAKFINKDGASFYVSIYLILALLGVLEAFLVHIITNSELKRLGYEEVVSEESTPLWIDIFLVLTMIIYLVLAIINPVYSCYAFPFLLAFYIPNVVESILINRHKWIYLINAILVVVSIFITSYINEIFYPLLLLVILLPQVIENFIVVLYTIYLKYSNNGKNKIE